MTQLPTKQFRDVAKGRISARLESALRGAPQIAALLDSIKVSTHTWAIVGGAPRVWALGEPEEPDDIDIVVGAAPRSVEILVRNLVDHNSLLTPILVSRTKLGGFRLQAQHHLFDVWSAEASVGLRRSPVTERHLYRRVARSAALSIDSLVYTSHGTLHEHGFFDTFATGVLTLNHCRVECPEAMARKAVRLCHKYQLYPELSLQSFMASFLDSNSQGTVTASKSLDSSRQTSHSS